VLSRGWEGDIHHRLPPSTTFSHLFALSGILSRPKKCRAKKNRRVRRGLKSLPRKPTVRRMT
jgi:hypothetical protein